MCKQRKFGVFPVMTAPLVAAFIAAVAPVAHGQIIDGRTYYYDNSATINTYIGGNNVIIGKSPGYAGPDTDITTPYTVNIDAGAYIDYDNTFSSPKGYFGLHAYNNTLVNISGGSVYYATAFDNSAIAVSGGQVSFANTYGASTLNLSSGSAYYVNAHNNSVANMSGGTVYNASAFDNATLNLSGGSVYYGVAAYGNGALNISGGSVGYGIYGYGNSVVSISGGDVNSGIYGYDSSTLLFDGNNLSATKTVAGGFLSGGSIYKQYNYAVTGSLLDGSTLNTAVYSTLTGASSGQLTFTGALAPELASDLYITDPINLGAGDIWNHVVIGQSQDGLINTSPIVNVAAPAVLGAVDTLHASLLNVNGGQVYAALAHDNSSVNLNGGNTGYANAQDNAVLTVNGGSVGTVEGYGSGTVNINSSAYYANAHDASTINISGGYLSTINAYDNSLMNITGGTVNPYATAYGASTLNISGGDVYYAVAHDAATTNISGGSLRAAYAYDNTTLNVSGGTVDDFVTALNGSTVNVSGGDIRLAYAFDNGTLNITGGALRAAYAFGDSAVNISGGSVNGEIQASENSVVTISGGAISGQASTTDAGVVLFQGSGLSATKNLLAGFISGDDNQVYRLYDYNVAGTLTDGSSLNELVYSTLTQDTPSQLTFTGSLPIELASDLYITDPASLGTGDIWNHVVIGQSQDGLTDTSPTVSANSPAVLGTVDVLHSSVLDFNNAQAFTLNSHDASAIAIGATNGYVSFANAYDTSAITISDPASTVVNVNAYNNSRIDIGDGFEVFVNANDASAVNISGGTQIFVNGYGNSTVSISGGNIYYNANAYDASILNISGGSIPTVTASGSSTVNVSGGSVYGYGWNNQGLIVSDASVANISGGSISDATASGASAIHISGGEVNTAVAYDRSVVTITGGTISSVAGANNDSALNISGGYVNFAYVGGNSAMTITGGTVGYAYAFGYGGTSPVTITGGTISGAAVGYGDAHFAISGGSVGDLEAHDTSVFDITGGIFSLHSFRAFDFGVFNVFGDHLTLSLLGTGSDWQGNYTLYNLSGWLKDGSKIATDFYDYDGGYQVGGPDGQSPIHLITVPEPGVVATFIGLFGGVGIGLLQARRRKG